MKKLLLVFTILLSITMSANSVDKVIEQSDKSVATVYKDGKSAITTVYNDAKSIAPEIASNIKGIAKELKVGADHVWQILVTQQKVWSIGFLFLTLSALINWLIFYRKHLHITLPSVKETQFITLERDIIGDIPNPNFNSYILERYNKGDQSYKNDPRILQTIKGVVGKEQYSCPQVVTTNDIEISDFHKGIRIIHFIICIILSGLSIYHFPSMLTGFINPEFGAMRDIIMFTSSLK